MVRFATFNASLNRSSSGELIQDLSTPDNAQAQAVSEIIQRVNPDVLLVNEFDYDAEGLAAKLFQENYLSVSQNGVNPVEYPFVYLAPSNTGIASGFDLDNNGEIVTIPETPGYGGDAFGFGDFPGQYGMVIYAKFPIIEAEVRTFQKFLWQDMPGALLPVDPNTGAAWYSEEELAAFRLSSKSHWDVPIEVDGEIIHVLVSHPTPPVFDGPEDRNGTRNHDEIRFFADYITPGKNDYIYDDEGVFGGLEEGAAFVIMGDNNADPVDGDSVDGAILQLLENPLVNTSVTPESEGGVEAAEKQGGANETHQGNPADDTADFNDEGSGNLRVDYVLPSENLKIIDAGIFWPTTDDPLSSLLGEGEEVTSDHRSVWVDVQVESEILDSSRKTITNLDFLGEVIIPTGEIFADTEIGGLSGITYDPLNQLYYVISDDRGNRPDGVPARFYTITIDLNDASLDDGDINFTEVITLLNENGLPFPADGIDPESIIFSDAKQLFIASEGNAEALLNPFVNEFSLTAEELSQLEIPGKFLPTAGGNSGIRDNLAFESLTITPDQRFLYTAVENALIQDGAAASLEEESAARIIQYDLATKTPVGEFLYFTDAIPVAANPPADFADNGLVELIAIDNTGTFLALERSFASGVGNNIRLYEVRLQGATDINEFESIAVDPENPDDGLFDVDAVAEKRLLLDLGELGIIPDNIEGMSLGPTLSNGQQSLILVSDNNFSESQKTQFLALGLDIDTIPAAIPTVETPPEVGLNDPGNPDADDPAIYVHPTDSSLSLVIATLKDAGLVVYDLEGEELQKISPAGIRYNNVDLVYNFELGGELLDLAVASDRANDTLAIFQIDPVTRQVINITAPNLSDLAASIFGVDDGEQTAYGLATYTSPISGKSFVFVSQADGNQIAQLELVDNGGLVDAVVTRIFTVPIPDAEDLEAAQVEGMVVDRELGYLYVGQENFGIWKFAAEPNSEETGVIVDTVENGVLKPDVEGLTIYYGTDGKGYLLASSQGDNTFAVYDRQGNNAYLGSFAVGETNNIDSVEESDGADIINVPLGEEFPAGLLVVQDGSNEPAVVLQDPEDGEIGNYNANFKYVDLEDLVDSTNLIELEPDGFDPRNPSYQPETKLLFGTVEDDEVFVTQKSLVFAGAGNDVIDASAGAGNNRIYGGTGNEQFFPGSNDRLLGDAGDDQFYAFTGGDNLITGGTGADQFWLANAEYPAAANTITDFELGIDVLGIAELGLQFSDLAFTQAASNTIVSAGSNQLGILLGVDAGSLSEDNFVIL
ncbi:MAG: phytase [Gomphosphaeria aponina SAG 52.96 = DSM 107014]|uniref:Phytase n=1 Tax=Gomphosphaeria aponina SAG 52.96 = DSM 107014 TaxID=1521640 RepID=A0A941JL40_9CHRO|nr:phytase [Gomphosphaeria aponina SAG 52.96 = DSM 107014]